MKIFVGMSGGVDSSVTAFLLKQQGFAVEGVFMKNWEEDDRNGFCSAADDLKDAERVADKLGIPLHSVNFSKEYWDGVFAHFLTEYRAGRTPNPDILCNKEIKFKAFLDYALTQGAGAIATGHYARISNSQLLKGLDPSKDQSYFLCALNQNALSKSLFPVGELEKKTVRQIAFEQGFENHAKKDSTGICFIGERKFTEFLREYLLIKPGLIKTPEGKTLGEHQGLMYYTIGQRQGLKIGGVKGLEEAPWYVVQKNIAENVLIVAQGEHPLLYDDALICENIHWISGHEPSLPFKTHAKIRYRQTDQACMITSIDQNTYAVKFEKPQRAITPGQSIVFYDGDICLGGGMIRESGIRNE